MWFVFHFSGEEEVVVFTQEDGDLAGVVQGLCPCE